MWFGSHTSFPWAAASSDHKWHDLKQYSHWVCSSLPHWRLQVHDESVSGPPTSEALGEKDSYCF